MTLRTRVLLVTGIALILLVSALYIVQRQVLLLSFAQLEEQQVQRNVRRAQRAIMEEVRQLDILAGDWAAWDDTYQFVQDHNEAYRKANLLDQVFLNARLNLIIIMDAADNMVFGRQFDLLTEQEIALPEFSPDVLRPGHPLLDHADVNSSKTGLVSTAHGPLLLASRPIVTSDNRGPIRGTLIMGRFLDESVISRIAHTTELDMTVQPAGDHDLPSDWRAALQALDHPDAIHVQRLGHDIVAGYGVLLDLYGQPAIIIEVRISRDLYRQGVRSIELLTAVLALGGVALLAVVALAIQGTVLRPIDALRTELREIADTRDPSLRVSEVRRDEIGQVAAVINATLTELQRAQDSVRERERYLDGLAKAAQSLLDPAADAPNERFLQALGEAARASRVYVFFTRPAPGGEVIARREAEWCAPGVESRRSVPELQGFPMIAGGFKRWLDVLRQGDPINALTADIPPSEQEVVRRDATQAILALPLILDGSLVGFIGFDQCDAPRAWQTSEVDLLRAAAADLAQALARKRSAQLQNSIYLISEAAHSAEDLPTLFRTVHDIINGLMPAQNLYIALHDARTDTVSFPYFVDEHDQTPSPRPPGRGVTEYVLRTGRPLLADTCRFQELATAGEIEVIGSMPVSWLGVPLQVGSDTIGVLAVQSYTQGIAFGEAERDILVYVSHQIAMAVQRTRGAQQLRRYAAELERANEEVKNFAYIVSHDLRSPLVNLSGFAAELRLAIGVLAPVVETALPQLPASEKAKVEAAWRQDIPEVLDFIRSALAKLDRLISALLKLSRLGRTELHLEPIDTAALVGSILHTLSHEIAQRQVRVSVGALPVIVADCIAMEQVFGNILDNALKYLSPERPGRIAITAERTPEETVFRIRDNGRGISAEDLPKLFMPFRRFGKQDVPGEGMGLPYVQALVQRHGGRIWAESQLDVGTTIIFTIPTHTLSGGMDDQNPRSNHCRS